MVPPHEYRLCRYFLSSRRSSQGRGNRMQNTSSETKTERYYRRQFYFSRDRRGPSFDRRVLDELTLNRKTRSRKVLSPTSQGSSCHAALAQGYVDRILPKPKLPRASKKKPRYFRLTDVARILAASQSELRVFYWLAAETGLRAGELAALTLADVTPCSITVSQAVWNGEVSTPKTQNALRTVAVSP
jgi:integrase